MNQTESQEGWFSRAKAEADKGIPNNERVTGIVLVVASVLVMVYFVSHQMGSTGFFTPKFGIVEMFLLYGSLVAWIITGSLDGIFGQRLLSRLFDVFGGILFITISVVWLLVIFPFEFAYFADVLPDVLKFLVQWISNDIARGIMVLGTILLVVAAIYSPIAYKFVNMKRSIPKKD
ncbi:MAG: hypothetical protein PVH73_05525 [Candidatus Bathyarchaeota archaeon]